MACNAAFANARDYAELICTRTLDPQREPQINRQLRITAGAIHAAMSASDQCDCDLAAWAESYLKHLNVVLTAATQDCPCSTINADQQAAYLAFVNAELEKIRTGQIDVCGGTGKDYPAFGAIELGLNVFNDAQIIENRIKRRGY